MREALYRAGFLLGVYTTSALFGLHLHSPVSESITLIWLPSGVAVAAVLLWKGRAAPLIFLAALLANLATGAGEASLMIAAGNTAEAMLTAGLFFAFRPDFFDRPPRWDDLLGLLAAAMAGCVLAAQVGVAALRSVDQLPLSHVFNAWMAWWSGDLLGIMFAAPLLIFFLRKSEISNRRRA